MRNARKSVKRNNIVSLPNDNISSTEHQQHNHHIWQHSVFICGCHYVVGNIQIFMSIVSQLELTLQHLTHMSTDCVYILLARSIATLRSSWLKWNAQLRNAYYCQKLPAFFPHSFSSFVASSSMCVRVIRPEQKTEETKKIKYFIRNW